MLLSRKDIRSRHFVLASQSPRRREIFQNQLGLEFEVIISGFAEDLKKSDFEISADYVQETSRRKALSVIDSIMTSLAAASLLLPSSPSPQSSIENTIVVSADTIVVLDNQILEKPSSREEAILMLQKLNGRCHVVQTAVSIAIFDPAIGGFQTESFVESTNVYFTHLTDAMIEAYVDTGEPMDKAGGYGIQSLASTFIERMEGCYYNVMGFPAHRFAKEIIRRLS